MYAIIFSRKVTQAGNVLLCEYSRPTLVSVYISYLLLLILILTGRVVVVPSETKLLLY